MTKTGPAAFEICTDSMLIEMVNDARRRLVLVAPALSKALADAIAQKWAELVPEAVNVILDTDPEVYRLGYGELEGLTRLAEAAKVLGTVVRRQPGVRIGLLIADDDTVVFTPTPLLIEAGPNTQTPGANAIRLGPPPAAVRSDLGLGGDREPVLGREPLSRGEMKIVSADLERNPPRRFDVARSERVFNAKFEFVEFELQNTFIARKKVTIPSDFMGLARDEQTKRLLAATFRLVDAHDDLLSGERIQRIKQRIIKNYLTVLPGYGTVVLRSVKPTFERRVEQLKRAVAAFQRVVEKRLGEAMDKNRETLVKALLPSVMRNPPQWWKKYGATLQEEQAGRLLGQELRKAFGDASQLVGQMRVRVVFKAVTYASLVDPKFQEVVKEKLPFLQATHDEHVAAPETSVQVQLL